MPRLVRTTRLAAPAACAALLAACAGADRAAGPGPTPGPVTPGSFDLRITKGFAAWRSVRGEALFGEIATPTAPTGFGVALGSTAPDERGYRNVVLFSRDESGTPAPGTYSLHDATSGAAAPADRFVLVVSTTDPSGHKWTCLGTSGNLTVASADGGRLKGSYDGSLSCVDSSAQPQAFRGTFTGTYDAVRETS